MSSSSSIVLLSDQFVVKTLFKCANNSPLFAPDIVKKCDLYGGEESWKDKFVSKETKKVLFLSELRKRYVLGRGFVRLTSNGMWMEYGRERKILDDGKVIGTKRRFKFMPKRGVCYEDKSSEEIWFMEEFRVAGVLLDKIKDSRIVICRVERQSLRQQRLKLQQNNENRRMNDSLVPLLSALSLQQGSNNELTNDDDDRRRMEEPLIPSFSTLSLGSNNEHMRS